MTENTENDSEHTLMFTEKEKFFLRISNITDLSVPPTVLEQLFPILGDEQLPEDFGKSKLMHDPSIVSYFLKQLYDDESNREILFNGIDDLFDHLTKSEMYVLLSEMSPMARFEETEKNEWKHAYTSHLLMHTIITENGFTQLRYLVPLMLIHDIGKLVLHQIVPETCKKVLELSRKKNIPCSEAELELLDMTHANAGARLLKEWHFPEKFVKPIQYHHSEEVPEEYILETALIKFVNWVDCHVRGIPSEPLDPELMTAAGIEEIDMDYWIKRQKKIVKETDRYFAPEGV